MKSREISLENLLFSLTVVTKHSQCPVALGSFVLLIFVDFSRDQWRYMTLLIGGEMRDNCIDELFFTPAPINVGFFSIWHSQVLRPPTYVCRH